MFMYGLPDFLFRITISLRFMPLDIPVPNAFEKASFAANLFAKQLVLLIVFLHFKISFSLKTRLRKFLFFKDLLIL